MSALKTVPLIALFLSGAPAAAEPLAETFASCTGRFSAELEHAWLLGTGDADEIERRRARYADLLDAVAGADDVRALMDRRINAKAAHAGLLSTAAFSRDEGRAEWARARAAFEIGYCASLLLDS